MRPEHYDLFSDERVRIPREGALLTEVAAGSPAGAHGVLDVSCGTGIHARFYAGLGYAVTARDISAESLERARSRPSEGVTYEVGDMRTSAGKKFGLLLATGNSLSAMATPRDLDAMMEACADQLVEGGRLFIQTLDYETFRRDGTRGAVKTGVARGVPVVVAKAMAHVDGDFVVSFTTLERGGDGAWASVSHVTRLNPWSPGEIRRAAGSAGLAVAAEYSSYGKEPFSPCGGVDYIAVFVKGPAS